MTAQLEAPRRTRTRTRELDVLRGAAVAGMILVNNQGSGAHAFWSLSHADWNGWTVADLVFPLFVFVLGGSMALAFARHPPTTARLVRRAAILFGIGFAMNALPPTALSDVTIMGVLQRLGLVYLLTGLLVRQPWRRQVAAAAAILVGYWLLLSLGPMRPDWSVPGVIDRFLLGGSHVYKNGFYDPEGLTSTPAAVVSALTGYWSVGFLRRREWSRAAVRAAAVVGAACVAAGLAWSFVLPVNKRLWTPSFVVLTTGWSLLALVGAHWIVRSWRAPRAVQACEVLGRNALAVFVGSELLLGVLRDRTGARVWLYQHVFVHLGFRLGSLAYAVALLVLWWFVADRLWRRRIVISV